MSAVLKNEKVQDERESVPNLDYLGQLPDVALRVRKPLVTVYKEPWHMHSPNNGKSATPAGGEKTK